MKESRTSKVSERADIATVLCVRKYLLTMPTETEDDKMTTNNQLMDGHDARARALEGSSPLTDADCLICRTHWTEIAFVVVDGIVKLPLL